MKYCPKIYQVSQVTLIIQYPFRISRLYYLKTFHITLFPYFATFPIFVERTFGSAGF